MNIDNIKKLISRHERGYTKTWYASRKCIDRQKETDFNAAMNIVKKMNDMQCSAELVCTYCGINPLKETCQNPKKCSSKKKINAN